MAYKLKDTGRKVYVIIGDGECQEGIIAESARIAAHYGLINLVCVVDANGYQSDKHSVNFCNIPREFRAYGWHTETVNGHKPKEIKAALTLPTLTPLLVHAQTVKGWGVSWMHGPDWHGSVVLDNSQLEKALRELE